MKFSIILLIAIIGSTQALHFYLTEGTEKCLTDDIPAQTSILGYTHLKDRLPGVPENSTTDGVTLTIYGPDKTEVFKKLTLEGKQKFAITAQAGGNYRFCLKTTTNHWISKNQKIRYGLKLVVGEQEQEVKDAVKQSHITNLQSKIDVVKIRAKEFVDYQQMNSKVEDDLAQANIKINDRVILFTIIETVIILGSGVFQILSLKKFFAQKRFTY